MSMNAAQTPWAISLTDTFLNELLNLPKHIAKRVERAIVTLKQDPISAGGNAKKLQGYSENIYRVRLGDYRLIYRFGSGWVKLLSIRKRDDRTYTIELPDLAAPPPPPDLARTDADADAYRTPPVPPAPVPPAPVPSNPVPLVPAPGAALPLRLTESLLAQWQIPAEYWQQVLQVTTEDDLLELDLPQPFANRIVDNLYPRPLEDIAAQPEYVLHTETDLTRFFEGELSAFLLKLDPEQEKLRSFGGVGPILVKGGPGTGKSTLALYRVQTLRDRGYDAILFATYTNALVTYSEQLLEQLLGRSPKTCGVQVATVDSLAYRAYIEAYGQPQFASQRQCLDCVAAALGKAPLPARNLFDRETRRKTLERLGLPYLLQEILDTIEGNGIATLEEYLAFPRQGRGVPLPTKIREAMWALYQTWQAEMTQQRLETWEQMRRQALAIVQQSPPPYQALVVDEAQDLSPVALRFLLALVPDFSGVYLTADASQSIYQRGFRWKQVHQDLQVTGRTLTLRRNYRNTQQILAACAAILEGTDAGDSDCLQQLPSAYGGDRPRLLQTDDLAGEAQAIRDFFLRAAKHYHLPLHGAAVLCPSTQLGKTYARQLATLGLDARFVSGKEIDLNAPYVKVLTLHAAKGLEFPFVAVVGLTAGELPRLDPNLPESEIPVAIAEQRRLLYVGCSRAMRSLLVCGSASRPSVFVDCLQAPHWH